MFDAEEGRQAYDESAARIARLYVAGAIDWAQKHQPGLFARGQTARKNIDDALLEEDAAKLHKNIYIHEQANKKIFQMFLDSK